MTRSNYDTTLCIEVEEILFWKSRSKWKGGGVPSSNDGCEIFTPCLILLQCGEVFSQTLKIFPFRKNYDYLSLLALVQRSSNLNKILIVKKKHFVKNS
jgi:hypothetical protein